ncbi:MAG: UvrD-helicase domain-containing protein [Bacteroidetes bacterium]|nr:UvrD-helicase domain-containing protein [Bacteroidota bacterium]
MKNFTLQSSTPANVNPENHPILSVLNPRQREAVAHTFGPLLIIAGAGSGKTRVLTYRIAYLLDQKVVQPYEILSLTFTNKAAKEMQERIGKLVGEEVAKKLWMGTFHSVFSKILRFECDKIGYNSNFSIYDSDDSERVVKTILQELRIDAKEIKPRVIRSIISSNKNELISPELFKQKFITSTIDDIAAQVYPIYEARLKKSNAMDFDDLLVKPIQLFEEHPEILEKYQDRFKFILIDEYQDTNKAQYEVTKMLAKKNNNICVVGDDAQSIYAFRGADIGNILDFQNDYPNAKKVPLEQNYRSTQAILKAADSVIKINSKQLDKTLWTENERGESIILLESYNERDEATRVGYHINNLRMRRGYKLNDFAILYRTNFQSRVFEDALRSKNMAYQLVGGLSFYQRKEVKDVMAYLKLLANPSDEESLMRIINEPARGIGAKTMQNVMEEARRHDVTMWHIMTHIDSYKITNSAKNKILTFVEMMNFFRNTLGQDTLYKHAEQLLVKSGYIQQYINENTDESLTRRDNVHELLNTIGYFEKRNPGGSLAQFLQEISLFSDSDNFDDDKPAITMMTIHASKGLEFPVVFIVGLEEDLFPMKARNANDSVDIEEERRLFYVAITRAQKELYFSFARSRFKFGEEKLMTRSRFLNEIDAAFVVTENGATIKQSGKPQLRPNSEAYADSKGYSVEYDKPSGSSGKIYTGPTRSTTIEYDDVSESSFRVGVKVKHDKFGPGKIIQKEGSGETAKITVMFSAVGQKKLLLKFAKLTIIS